MSYRNRTLSEKKRIYKKLGLVIAAILVVCIALAIALRPTKGNASHNASGTQAVDPQDRTSDRYCPCCNTIRFI